MNATKLSRNPYCKSISLRECGRRFQVRKSRKCKSSRGRESTDAERSGRPGGTRMCRQVFRHVRNRFVAQSRWAIASVDSRPRLDVFSLRVFMFVPGRKLGQAPATLRFDVSQSHFLRPSRCTLVRGRTSHAVRRRACRIPREFPERMGSGSRLCGCLTPFAPAIVQPTLPALFFSRAGSGGTPLPRAWGRRIVAVLC